MQPYEYRTLFDHEASHWWYAGLRSTLLSIFQNLPISGSRRILDAGCGTGMNLASFRETISLQSFGFDLSADAAPFWARRGLDSVCLASINQIPYREASFDAALCVDVLECTGVSEKNACRELCRVVRPGGYIVFVVPAYRWLMDRKHHRAVHADKRYTRADLRRLWSDFPVRILRLTHLFLSLFPAVAFYRVFQRILNPDPGRQPRSDVGPVNPSLNRLLYRIAAWERRWVLGGDLPFGSSILGIVQREAP